MTLLQEILQAATDSSVDITTVLRKGKILATRLKSREFGDWVHRELNGYEEGAALPPYRVIKTSSRGHLLDVFRNRQYANAPIMDSLIPEKFRHIAIEHQLKRPISEYVSILKTADGDQNGQGVVQASWPQEIAIKFGASGYNGFECIGAWQVLSAGTLAAVIDTVRNRLLDFVIEIQEAAPNAGETEPGAAAPIPPEMVTQIFNTYVSGGVSNISGAGSTVTQFNSGQVNIGELNQLLEQLRSAGVAETDVAELRTSLEANPDKKSAAREWLGKLALSAATDTAGTVIGIAGKAIAGYLGIGG